ncbi:MFS transporter [Micromonospora sp. M12]
MIISLIVAGAVLAVLFVLQEARVAEPILPLRLFRSATFALANSAGFVLGLVMFGSIIFIPLYLQIVKGASPTRSGLLMLPMMAGIIVTSILTGRAMSRIGRYKWFPVAGSATLVAGMLLFTQLQVGTSLWVAFGFMAVIGIGLGLCMQSLVLAVQNAVSVRDLGAGTSSATFFRSLGGSFGVAILGTLLSSRLNSQLADRLPARSPSFRRSSGPRSRPVAARTSRSTTRRPSWRCRCGPAGHPGVVRRVAAPGLPDRRPGRDPGGAGHRGAAERRPAGAGPQGATGGADPLGGRPGSGRQAADPRIKEEAAADMEAKSQTMI